MKIIKTANGKRIQLSKKEWESIGKMAGWGYPGKDKKGEKCDMCNSHEGVRHCDSCEANLCSEHSKGWETRDGNKYCGRCLEEETLDTIGNSPNPLKPKNKASSRKQTKLADHPKYKDWYGDVDSNDPDWIADQLKMYLENPSAFWSNMTFQTGKGYKKAKDKQSLLKELLMKLKNASPTLEMLSKEDQKGIAKQILALKEQAAEEEEADEKFRSSLQTEEGLPVYNDVPSEPEGGVGTALPEKDKIQREMDQARKIREENKELGSAGLDTSIFATPKQVEEIKNQLLDRYINKEITEEQLKTMLTEFAKKHKLNIRLSKSNGRLQIRIGKRIEADFGRELEDSKKERALIDWEREEEEKNILKEIMKADKVSNCCGEKNRMLGPDGPDYSDIGICPKCKGHCEFTEE